MPELIDDKGAGGDDAAAKAVADKAAADAAAAATGAGNGAGDGEETVTMKKADLKKIEEERDNYKKGLLAKKADERELKPGAAAAAAAAGAGAAVIDEKKIAETASAAASKTMRDAAERTAKRAFLQAHPEYVDDSAWASLMSHLTFKGKEITHDEIADRMEAAVLEHKRSTGKLDEYLKSERERGVREGRIQERIDAGHGSGQGDRNDGRAAGALTPKGEEMARAMHTDVEQVKKVDPSKDNVIDLFAPRKKA